MKKISKKEIERRKKQRSLSDNPNEIMKTTDSLQKRLNLANRLKMYHK